MTACFLCRCNHFFFCCLRFSKKNIVFDCIFKKVNPLKHDGKIKEEDIIDITDIIEKRRPGRESDDEIIVYSVGGMPVEDIAWGGTVYRNAVKMGIGIKLPLWDKPEMA